MAIAVGDVVEGVVTLSLIHIFGRGKLKKSDDKLARYRYPVKNAVCF